MAPKLPIYMDNHATTPVDARVLDAMLPYFREDFGNAASRRMSLAGTPSGPWSRRASRWRRSSAPRGARSSGPRRTESDNLAIKGAADFYRDRGNHIITAATEHKAVLDTCKRLEKSGFEVTYLPVERDGRVNPQAVADALTDRTIVVSIMLANNEVGTINPVAEIGQVVKARGAIFTSMRSRRGQDSLRRRDLARRSGFPVGAQDVRSQGRGRALRARKPRVRITPSSTAAATSVACARAH